MEQTVYNARTLRAAVNDVAEKDKMGFGRAPEEIRVNRFKQSIELLEAAMDIADSVSPPTLRNAPNWRCLLEEWKTERHRIWQSNTSMKATIRFRA